MTTSERGTLKESAFKHCQEGRAVIPLIPDGSKAPLFKWKNGDTNYQKIKPTIVEVTEWWSSDPTLWPAVVTGHDGLAIWDIDDGTYGAGKAQQFAKHTRVDLKPENGNCHIWMVDTNGAPRTRPQIIKGVCDLKGVGGYVACPPANGYERISNMPPMEVPDGLSADEYVTRMLRSDGYEPEDASLPVENFEDVSVVLKEHDGRNTELYRIGRFLQSTLGWSTEQVEKSFSEGINKPHRYNPPLSETELKNTVFQSMKVRTQENIGKEMKHWLETLERTSNPDTVASINRKLGHLLAAKDCLNKKKA